MSKYRYSNKRAYSEKLDIAREAKSILHTFEDRSMFRALRYVLKYGACVKDF